MPDQEIKDAALSFEAIKVKMIQDKTGYLLTIRIHPESLPGPLVRHWVGTRYQVVMVEVGDDENPVIPPEVRDAGRLVTSAVMLCKELKFQTYMGLITGLPIFNDTQCREALIGFLGIDSRSKLKVDEEAQERFVELRSAFLDQR